MAMPVENFDPASKDRTLDRSGLELVQRELPLEPPIFPKAIFTNEGGIVQPIASLDQNRSRIEELRRSLERARGANGHTGAQDKQGHGEVTESGRLPGFEHLDEGTGIRIDPFLVHAIRLAGRRNIDRAAEFKEQPKRNPYAEIGSRDGHEEARRSVGRSAIRSIRSQHTAEALDRLEKTNPVAAQALRDSIYGSDQSNN